MSKRKTIYLALITMLLWGSLFPVVKLGYGLYNVKTTSDILFFAGVRFTICGSAICLYSLIRRKENYIPVRKSVVPILLFGLFAIILHYGFTYTGLRLTDSSKTAILKQVGALFYICFSALFFKDDRLTAKKLTGALLGFLGIIAVNATWSGISFHIGDAFIIAASFCTVFSNVISKKVFLKVDPITATGCSQLFGGIVLLITGFAMGGRMSFSFGLSAFAMVYICIASVLSYCIWFVTVKDGELSKLFIIKFAEPMFASILGAVILGENIFNIQYITAFLLISGGIFISNR